MQNGFWCYQKYVSWERGDKKMVKQAQKIQELGKDSPAKKNEFLGFFFQIQSWRSYISKKGKDSLLNLFFSVYLSMSIIWIYCVHRASSWKLKNSQKLLFQFSKLILVPYVFHLWLYQISFLIRIFTLLNRDSNQDRKETLFI